MYFLWVDPTLNISFSCPTFSMEVVRKSFFHPCQRSLSHINITIEDTIYADIHSMLDFID